MPGKREDLTDGQKLYFELTPDTGVIVTTAEEYHAAIVKMIEFVMGDNKI
jgi:hypothetical protein